MKDLREYVEEDVHAQYEDEKVVSDLYHTSLVVSLRQLDSIKSQEIRLQNEETNKWLLNQIPMLQNIATISLDQLKLRIDGDKKSCDGFFYYASKDGKNKSIMFEYKNVSKEILLTKYWGEDDKSIYQKVRDSINIIKNEVSFEDGYNGEELINNTHLVIIYAENNLVSEAGIGKIQKQKVERDVNGRQRGASKNIRFNRMVTKKSIEEKMDEFCVKLSKLGMAEVVYDYFGVSNIDPKAKQRKGFEKNRQFSLMTKSDWKKVIEEKEFFKEWNWGSYKDLF